VKRGRRALLILCGCVLVACVVWVAWPGEREPEYKGRKLSEWIRIYEKGTEPYAKSADVFEADNAIKAVCAIRDEVLPWGLRKIQEPKPEWEHRAMLFMEGRVNIRRWCPSWVWVRFYREPANEGVACLMMLGTNLVPAFPVLENIATNQASETRTAERAVGAIGAAGAEGFPVLRRVATNQFGNARVSAILRIGRFGDLATPVFATCVEDRDTDVKLRSMWGIRELRLDPAECIPALTNQLHHSEPMVRSVAVDTIANFGPEARAVLPSLLEALDDSDSSVRASATNALERVAPEVLTNGVAP